MSQQHFASRGAGAAILTVALLVPGTVAGQSAASAGKTWSPPRTPDGHPDLQGTWTNVTLTPFERPRELAGKEYFTEQEAAAYEKQMLDRREETPEVAGDGLVDKHVWWEQGRKVTGTRRTSMVVEPRDGRVPPLTPEARQAAAARAEMLRRPATGPEDRTLEERCLLWSTAGPPMMPSGYNSNYQIAQAPGYVVILIEMIHDVRIIPLDGRPHLGPDIRQWLGDSRGHWEGETLVVDTTNFTDQTHFRGSDRNLHLVERFTRIDAETILYRFTVDDPTVFTKPWTAEGPMTKASGPIYEFACHEGNRAMVNILSIARAAEKATPEATKQGSK
jgi:hypothetical protein